MNDCKIIEDQKSLLHTTNEGKGNSMMIKMPFTSNIPIICDSVFLPWLNFLHRAYLWGDGTQEKIENEIKWSEGKCGRRKNVHKDGCLQVDCREMGYCSVWKSEFGVLVKKNKVIQLGTNTMYLVFDGTFIVDILFLH